MAPRLVPSGSSVSLPVSVADGGTGATTVGGAQTNLGVDSSAGVTAKAAAAQAAAEATAAADATAKAAAAQAASDPVGSAAAAQAASDPVGSAAAAQAAAEATAAADATAKSSAAQAAAEATAAAALAARAKPTWFGDLPQDPGNTTVRDFVSLAVQEIDAVRVKFETKGTATSLTFDVLAGGVSVLDGGAIDLTSPAASTWTAGTLKTDGTEHLAVGTKVRVQITAHADQAGWTDGFEFEVERGEQ